MGHALGAIETHHKIIALDRTEFDLCDANIMSRVLDSVCPDIVINTAAWTDVDGAETHPKQAEEINFYGTKNLSQLCNKNRIGLVHISTDYVFDGASSKIWREDDTPIPQTLYGKTKLSGEQAISQTHPNHAIIRTSWVFGPHGRNFLKTMLRLAKTNTAISVVNDQIGCPTYAPHLAQALILIAEKLLDGKECGVLHLSGSTNTSWAGFAEEIFKQSAKLGGPSAAINPIPTSQFPTPAKRPANSVLDCSLAKSRFGICLPDFKTGIEQCLQLLPDLR